MPKRRAKQMIDRLGLVKKRSFAGRPSDHCASERGIEWRLTPRLAGAERAMRLIEWLLGEKERFVELGLQRLTQTVTIQRW